MNIWIMDTELQSFAYKGREAVFKDKISLREQADKDHIIFDLAETPTVSSDDYNESEFALAVGSLLGIPRGFGQNPHRGGILIVKVKLNSFG